MGKYEVGDNVINEPLAKHGNWIYNLNAHFYQPGRIITYNISTKEKILKKNPATDADVPISEFQERNLILNKNEKVTAADLQKLPQLSVPKESGVITFGAFFILFIFGY